MCFFALWAPSSHAFATGSHGRCCAARDGHVRGGWDTWMDGFAVSNHACCGRAGMLVRPHGTRLHPTRVSACSQATQPTQDRLLHAVRHRRQRGASSSTGGVACRSRWYFLALWHEAVSSVHSCERLRHDAAAPIDRTVSRLCATGRMPCRYPFFTLSVTYVVLPLDYDLHSVPW